ncbi:MAG: Tfp pilus assembly protein FimT/FimU [Thermodesulfobacteriota bacterium]
MLLREKKGYSMIEVLVVLAVMATLVAIGTPAIVSLVTHQRVKRSARDVFTELNGARINAITQNTKYRLEFTLNTSPSTPDTFRLARWNKATAAWEPDPRKSTMEVNPGIDIISPTASFNVEFFPNGTATAQSICLQNTSDATDRMKVDVQSSTGKLQIGSIC